MKIISIVFELTGMAAMAYGSWLAWPPAGFVVGGLVVLLIATALGGDHK